MSPDRRAPWWYSGDDDLPVAGQVADTAGVPEPTADPEPSAGEGPTAMDWTALVAGAARMVDWATERVIAPHAEHENPAEHPDCMVCRTVALIGDPAGLMTQRPPADDGPAAADEGDDAPGPWRAERRGAEPIRWIPIVESHD